MEFSKVATVDMRSELTSVTEQMLDSDQAAALLRIHPKTLQRMARRGEVVGVRIGKLWRFRGSDLMSGSVRTL